MNTRTLVLIAANVVVALCAGGRIAVADGGVDMGRVIDERGRGSREARWYDNKKQVLREEGKLPQPRTWKPWDAGVSARLSDSKYLVGEKLATGSITPGQVNDLKGQERRITDLIATFKPNGKLSDDQCKQVRKLLDETSKLMYQGTQMEPPKLNGVLLKRLDDNDLIGAEGEELCAQMRRVRELTRALGGDPTIRPEQRSPREKEFDLLNAILHD